MQLMLFGNCFPVSVFSLTCSLAISAAEPVVHMLVPGFTVQELPVRLSNINNLRFAPDGRLTALGYDGRIHLLRDTDGDGLEDQDELFWDKPTIQRAKIGMVWSPRTLRFVPRQFAVARHGPRWQADIEEIIASGWPQEMMSVPAGVDATR
jgi:hypothetical protein